MAEEQLQEPEEQNRLPSSGRRIPGGDPLMRIPAISLWQPHATAISIGLKPYETRDWPTRYRGPVAIHASLRPIRETGWWMDQANLKFRQWAQEYRAPVRFPLGAILCVADLVACFPTHELRDFIPAEHEFWGDFSDGKNGVRYAFRLRNIRPLPEPFVTRGYQRMFHVELPESVMSLPLLPGTECSLYPAARR